MPWHVHGGISVADHGGVEPEFLAEMAEDAHSPLGEREGHKPNAGGSPAAVSVSTVGSPAIGGPVPPHGLFHSKSTTVQV